MIYTIEITEVLQKQIKICSESEEQALEMAEELYKTEQEVLTAENLINTGFEVIGEE